MTMQQPVDLAKLAEARGRAPEGRRPPDIDPVTAEVIRGAMETTCVEVATHVSLTATTPILNQSNERNASIMDWQGRLAALSAGVPQFMLSSTLPVRFALDFFGKDGLADGDVILSNDPYHGGGHLPDYNVFAPVFDADGELVLIVSIQCHHGDTGGAAPGGYPMDALDVWAEGVRFPAVKIIEAGKERRDILYMLQANNRLPTYMGDIRAQIGACRVGVRRLKELTARYGAATIKQAVDYMIWHSEQRFRDEVRAWPSGVYEADVYADRDPQGNEDIHVHCAVTVHDDGRLIVDFDGSDTRDNLGSYSAFGNTRGYVVSQLAAMMDPDIPKTRASSTASRSAPPKGRASTPATARRSRRGRTTPAARSARRLRWPCRRPSPSAPVPRSTSSPAPP